MSEPQTKSIPSLKDFVFASADIRQAVNDLEIYWQLSNQAGVKLYTKWQGKKYFVLHNLKEIHDYIETKELFDLTTGKPWSTLISAIDLVARYSTEVSMEGFNKLKPEYKLEILDIVSKGQDAYEKISEWLKPIDEKKCIEAIHDCVKVKIGNSVYDSINILKLTETKSISTDDNTIGLYPNVIEVDSPQSLISYFKENSEPTPDSLIVTFMKDKKYNDTPHIFLFLIYRNNFYVLNMDEQNLNQSWTTGMRHPDRYEYWYHFPNIWLPFKMILEPDKQSKSTDVVFENKRITKQASLNDIFAKSPEAKVWLDMFIYRVLDWFESNKEKVMLGTTPENVLKPMLEYKQQKAMQSEVKLSHISFDEESVHMGESFASNRNASSYLFEKYHSKMTSVVPSIEKVPMMIATKEHIENVILFEQRKLVAEQLQKFVNEDYKKNHKKVYKWFDKLVHSRRYADVIKKALLNKEYSFAYYGGFSNQNESKTIHIQGTTVKLVGKNTIQKRKLLTVYDCKKDHLPNFWGNEDLSLKLIMMQNKSFWSEYPKRNVCNICKKFSWYYLIELSFIDYRQILEFFEIDQIPKEYVEHLHYQNTYHENTLINDADPANMVLDPYFRETVEGQSVTLNGNSNSNPEILVFYGLCKRCFKENGGVYID